MEKAISRPKIGLISAIAFAVGTMIGAGVFVLSGPAIALTGPAALISYATAGVSVLFSALSFSVIASLAPAGASGFAYVRTALGGYWGFITSWAFYIGGIIGCAFILNAFGTYLQQFFLPSASPLFITLMAAFALTLLNLGPASAIGKAEVFFVGIKVLALLTFIIMGARLWGNADLAPFAPNGWKPVFHESGQLFVAFLGFSVICSMGGDIKNASRTIPLAILLSMLIVALIYCGVIMSLLGANLGSYSESSIGKASGLIMGSYGPRIIAIAALVSVLSCANASILSCSESMVRLAGKGEVPTFLGKMHNGHPVASVFIGAVIYIGLILIGRTDAVVSYTNVSTIVMLVLVNIAALYALKKKLVYKKLFPFSLLIPVLGLTTGIGQLFMMRAQNVLIGCLFVAMGSVFYLMRKKFHDVSDHREIKENIRVLNGPLSRSLKEEGPEERKGKSLS
ncbi:MAG: APC family permease [Bacteroidia bacterium]